MDIITGYRAEAHITSQQDRALNMGVISEGNAILPVGQQLLAEAVSANEVRIYDGVLSMQGCVAMIADGGYESLEISNGAQGYNRIDLIVARYTKDSGTSVEDVQLVVIEGTPTAGAPTEPTYNTGRIAEGATPVDMPLYAVNIVGITIDSITAKASVMPSLYGIRARIGTAALNTQSVTLAGAINEHESDIIAINNTTVNGNRIGSGNMNLGYGDVGAAPVSHASSEASTPYGGASASAWGHAKVVNNHETSTHETGVALSAYQGYYIWQALQTAIAEYRSLIQSNNGTAPTATEQSQGASAFYPQYNGKNINLANFPASHFILFLQASAGMNKSAIYSIGVSTTTVAIELIGGSEDVLKAYVSGNSPNNVFVRSMATSGVSVWATLIKTQ